MDIEFIRENYPEALLMDGYDCAIVGVVTRFAQPPIVCYSKDKIIDMLIIDDGMSYDEALEFFEFNQLGAWVGDTTPCFIEM